MSAKNTQLPDLRPLVDSLLERLETEGVDGIKVNAHVTKDEIEEEDGKEFNVYYREDYVLVSDVDPVLWDQNERFFDHDAFWEEFKEFLADHFIQGGVKHVVFISFYDNHPVLEPVGVLLIRLPNHFAQEMEISYQTEDSLALQKKRASRQRKNTKKASKKIVRDGIILVDENGVRLGTKFHDAARLLHIHGFITDGDAKKVSARLAKFKAKYPEAFPKARKTPKARKARKTTAAAR